MSKKILITGGAGFIAHHVVDLILKKTDWEIVTLDRLDFSGNLNRLQEVVRSYDKINQKRVKVVFHDLKAEINPEVKALIGKVDYIAHLAAGSHVDRSIKYPLEFVKDNVLGTANMLEFARSIDSLEKFIYFSTDEVFGPALKGKQFKENERYNSTNPYSASKAGGEELVVAYENTYGLPSIITHTMNVFGERQNPEKFIPMVIKKVRDKYADKVIIAGNVVTPEMTEELIINGADVVKIGIGPGSVCTTRTMTGVGVPQFSAILDCADAANGVDGHIMADGGCVHPGDIAKAFGGGASRCC